MVNFGSIYTTFEKLQQQIGIEFVKIKTWTVNGPKDENIDVDFENGTITVNQGGNYVVNVSLSFKGTNERIYTVAMFTNGVEGDVQIKKYFGPNLRSNDIAALGIVEITSVPAVLDIRVKCDRFDSNVVVMQNAQFTIFALGE